MSTTKKFLQQCCRCNAIWDKETKSWKSDEDFRQMHPDDERLTYGAFIHERTIYDEQEHPKQVDIYCTGCQAEAPKRKKRPLSQCRTCFSIYDKTRGIWMPHDRYLEAHADDQGDRIADGEIAREYKRVIDGREHVFPIFCNVHHPKM